MAEIKTNPIVIQPTVFVALGGTGFKVCTELYDLIDSYVGGAGKYCNCLQFVFIDTIANSVGNNPGFQSIHCPCETRQIRQLGHQTFFQHNSEIVNALEEAVQRAETLGIVHSSPKLQASGVMGHIRVNDGLKFLVVASVAGGTGGGMLIDILSLLHDKFAYKGDIDLHILGASHFVNLAGVDSDTVKANAYASLQELNHFHSNGRHLADHIFLYENANNSGKVHNDAEKFCTSLAQLIFRDYTFALSAQIKRDESENVRMLASKDYKQMVPVEGYPGFKYTKNFSQRFQTRGYAALAVPHERMIEAASYRLAKEVIECLNSTVEVDIVNDEEDLFNTLNLLPSYGLNLRDLYLDGKISFNGSEFFKSLPGEDGSIYRILAALTSVADERKNDIDDMADEFGQNDCFMLLKRMEKPIPEHKNDECQKRIESSIIEAIKSMDDVVSIGGILRKNSYTIVFKLKLQLDILLKDIPENKRFHAMVSLRSVLANHMEDINKAIAGVAEEKLPEEDYEELIARLKNIKTNKVFGIPLDQKAKDDDRSVLARYCYNFKFGEDANGKDIKGELVAKLLVNVLKRLSDICQELDRYLSEKINQIVVTLPAKLESWVNSAVEGQVGIVKVRDILASLNVKLAKIYGPFNYYSLFGE
ncbi:hypothetical protein IJT10_01545, partial [bacterium]|nr:hypothetical protein [bacterium]